MQRRLTIEFLILYFAIPFAFAWIVPSHGWVVFPVLILLGLCTFTALWRDPTFDRQQLWNLQPLRREWPSIALLLIFGGAAVAAAIAYVRPELLFNFPRQRPAWWALIMVLYPLISVIPQQLTWRALLFHRYRPLFPTDRAMIVASAVAFSFLHIAMWNALAMALTLVGGAIFAWRYARTRSNAVGLLEHALWGDLLFTIGLGAFFYIK